MTAPKTTQPTTNMASIGSLQKNKGEEAAINEGTSSFARTCNHSRMISVLFPLDYLPARDGFLRDVCAECGAWRYIGHPTDRLWHAPQVAQ